MKKWKALIALTIIVVLSLSTVALAADMGPKPIDVVLAEIRQEQGIGSTDPINADKVSAAKLEELGDSVMEVMIGNSAMHEQMDSRLGGDGSATLTAYHKNLGYNYLTGRTTGMMGLPGGGMMNFNRGGMMGYYSGMGAFGWIAMAFGALVIIAIILLIVFALVRISRRQNAPHSQYSQEVQQEQNNRALDILAERYAKGELSDAEYKQKKAELRN